MRELTPDRLLTQAEVRAILRVSPKTLQNWRHRGRLKFIQFGYHTVRIRESEVARLCEEARTR